MYFFLKSNYFKRMVETEWIVYRMNIKILPSFESNRVTAYDSL